MAIKTFDAKDQVPEAQREAALEIGGKWVIEEIDPNAISTAAQTALGRIREEKASADRARVEAETKLAQLQREHDARKAGATEEEIEKRRKEIDDATKPLREQLTAAQAKLRQVLHLDRVRVLALAAGIMPDRIDDAMLILERRTDLTDDSKGLVVKDKDGSISAQRVEDFLARDFKSEKPWLYAGTGTSGSGARPGNAPAPGADRAARTQEQIAAEKRSVVSSAF